MTNMVHNYSFNSHMARDTYVISVIINRSSTLIVREQGSITFSNILFKFCIKLIQNLSSSYIFYIVLVIDCKWNIYLRLQIDMFKKYLGFSDLAPKSSEYLMAFHNKTIPNNDNGLLIHVY